MFARGDLYQFGRFRLDPEVGILFYGAEPTMLGQRAVALLRLLIQNAGAPVSKDAYLRRMTLRRSPQRSRSIAIGRGWKQ
ncbi:MAG: hypothetical protein EOS81_07835 [Mesorhizobium sp.]|nr:hypothetical protein EJ072_20185 [Mesorhizobium sp. M2A.F.Ca.ET.046.03.2.1]RVC70922.1 hypothetical protein EN759_02145 [Mesorhizobium sp. M00.F.Ca.ET.038.03.1.1]RVC77611.1 hypothetical protein EN766_11225 [Mesorhizobium sp. M2A.F.Ca.ET.046.02.1.1]RWB45045.1 MAG: hypothetical protein EOQ44_14050 [Mesorhizobium sp.]RWE20854.1 MAG: hypothetical protein EOS76_06715 [Mesorhizobium sp.]